MSLRSGTRVLVCSACWGRHPPHSPILRGSHDILDSYGAAGATQHWGVHRLQVAEARRRACSRQAWTLDGSYIYELASQEPSPYARKTGAREEASKRWLGTPQAHRHLRVALIAIAQTALCSLLNTSASPSLEQCSTNPLPLVILVSCLGTQVSSICVLRRDLLFCPIVQMIRCSSELLDKDCSLSQPSQHGFLHHRPQASKRAQIRDRRGAVLRSMTKPSGAKKAVRGLMAEY